MDEINYLLHIPKKDHLTGLLHQRNNLFALFMEAKLLNRTAVIPPLLLNGKHNHGKDIETSWEKYIDVEKLRSFHPFVFQEELVDFDSMSKRFIDETVKPQDQISECTPMLIRQHKRYPNYYILIKTIDRKDWYLDLLNLFQPSETIRQFAKIAINEMKEYHCLHVRRGDKLHWKQCPGLNKVTQPEKLKKFLSKYIGKRENLYIMSNETRKGYFDVLKKDFAVYTFNDFPEYVQFENSDNYFLFMVENEIMSKAQIKIKTFREEGYLSLLDYGPNGKDLLSNKIRRKIRGVLKVLFKN